MTDSLMGALMDQGVGEERLHSEAFASPVSFDRQALPERDLSITVRGQTLRYQGRQTLLECLEEHGIDHPFACRVGVCSSCKCQVDGAVTQITDAGLSPKEKRSGYVLACVAFPETDLKVHD